MRLRRTFAALLLVALAVAFALWHWSREEPRSFVLADGSRLEICAVTLGTNGAYSYGNPWQRIAANIPGPLGSNWSGGTRLMALPFAGTTNMVFWFRLLGDSHKATHLRFELVDDAGVSVFWPSSSIRPFHWSTPKTFRTNDAGWHCQLSVWPRRSRFLNLRVYDRKLEDDRKLVGQARISNPGFSAYPDWEHHSLPIRQRAGEAVIALEQFDIDRKVDSRGLQVERPYPWTAYLAFRITDQEAPEREWLLWQSQLRDATGNQLPNWGGMLRETEQQRLALEIPWLMWPGEGCVRFESLWIPKGKPQADTFLELKGLPLIGTHRFTRAMVATNLGPVLLRVLSRRESDDEPYSCNVLMTSMENPLWNSRDTLRPLSVEGTDERGRKIDLKDQIMSFSVPADARTVDLRIGLVRCHYAEFYVRPKVRAGSFP